MNEKKMLYANSAEIRSSFYDLIFTFATKAPGTDGKTEAREEMDVIMSPQHAKTFLYILQGHISKYEDSFGTIELPPELQGKFNPRKPVM